jgi:hypothetical protein
MSHACLGFNAASCTDDLAWFENTRRTPFLFPSNKMGPDLIFVLRLPSHRYFWVVVQVNYLSDANLGHKTAINDVTPSQFYVEQVCQI